METQRTIETDLLKETANRMMANSQDCLKDARDGIFLCVQTVLMDSGQYRGFKFLSVTDGTRKKFY